MRFGSRGLTMIELMIVITIISILAMIAIPNLMRAKMAANETSAIAELHKLFESQVVYKRKDWGTLPQGSKYAQPYYYMYQITPANQPQLIDPIEAYGHIGWPGGATPKTGYYFMDVLRFAGDAANIDPRNSLGMCGMPASFDVTGVNSFYIDAAGHVWQHVVDPLVSGPLLIMPHQPNTWNFTSTTD